MDDRVRLPFSAGIADVRLARADRMNALDPVMFEAFRQVLAELSSREGLRAVVLSGEGRGFCAGLPIENFRGEKRAGNFAEVSA
jgi:enoyl-CoA hydratase/carnithine racemase